MKSLRRLLNAFVLSALAASAGLAQKITGFAFEIESNEGKIYENIICDIYGDSLITGIIPFQQQDLNLTASFSISGGIVSVDGIGQESGITTNDFSSPVTYSISSGETIRTYRVKLVYTGLPVIYVNTEDAAPITSKEDYVDGTLRIYPNDASAVYVGALQIRGRGNSTWTLDKKPYRIKLSSGAGLLGMPSDRDWVLLANHSDKTLMRNSLAFYLGDHMHFPYTPRSVHVELVLNGAYKGNYLLVEQVEVNDDKIDIKELDDDDVDPVKITGGYLLELDEWLDGLYFKLKSNLPFIVKSPDEITDLQLDYISNYMQETEDAIFATNFTDPIEGYRKYISVDTFIEFYWVNELFKTTDASDHSSIFYYKDRDQKLNMGPLWDFDQAAGNINFGGNDDPSGFFLRNATWFRRLFADPAFRNAVDQRWLTFRDELLSDLPNVIDAYAEKLRLSQEENFHRWDVLNKYVWPNPVITGSYHDEVAYLKNWLRTRIAWIDAQVTRPALNQFELLMPPTGVRVVAGPDETDRIEFSWRPSTPGTSYEVLMDEPEGDFSEPIARFGAGFYLMDTTANARRSDLYNIFEAFEDADSITLKWSVRAFREDEEFYPATARLITLVNAGLEIPELISPKNEATIKGATPVLKWKQARAAQTYNLDVSSHSDFETLLVTETGLTDTTYTMPDDMNGQYYWRVRSVNTTGQSDWSEKRSFTTVVLGMEDNGHRVSIYPNPAGSELYIDGLPFDSIESATFVDTMGRTAMRVNVWHGATKIDVSHLSRGMYVMILHVNPGLQLTQKIVLR